MSVQQAQLLWMDPVPVSSTWAAELNVRHDGYVTTVVTKKSWHLSRKMLNYRGAGQTVRWYYKQTVGQSLLVRDNPEQILSTDAAKDSGPSYDMWHCVHKSSSPSFIIVFLLFAGLPRQQRQWWLLSSGAQDYISHDHRLHCMLASSL